MQTDSTPDRSEFLYPSDRRAVLSLLTVVLVAYCTSYFVLSAIGRPTRSSQIHHAYLAESFLQGRLDVDPARTSRLSELVPYGDKWYVVYPPFPAVAMMPLVFVLGAGFGSTIYSAMGILFAAAAAPLTFIWLRRVGRPRDVAWWAALLLALGTGMWYCTMRGSSWLIAHTMGVALLTASLCEAMGRKRGVLAGFLLGAALLCRLPIALATPFVAYLAARETDRKWRTALMVFVGAGLFVAANMAYNWVRFDSVLNVAYDRIPGVLEEPWYFKGILHPSYLPSSLHVMLLQPPVLIDRFPYWVPSLFGMSLLLATPALFMIFAAPLRCWRTWFLVTASGACLLPGLLHGWPGGDQFGYRFSLDAAPFIVALMATGMGERASGRARFLIVLSVLICIWGLLFVQSVPVQWLYPLDHGS